MGRAAQKARTYAELAPKEHGRLYVDCLRAQAEVLQDLDRGTEAEQALAVAQAFLDQHPETHG